MSETANKEYAPHQQRVVDEANELKDKFSKLGAFILDNPIFLTLIDDEQQDLSEQYNVMEKYIVVLDRRIARF
jgi:hypothetical protein